ncbi:hypothetical protein GQ457_05G033900 [Hibiscus cannabinus]
MMLSLIVGIRHQVLRSAADDGEKTTDPNKSKTERVEEWRRFSNEKNDSLTSKGLNEKSYEKVLVLISLGAASFDDCGLNIDFVLGLEGPSIHPSVPSVGQSRFSIQRGKSLYFRLTWSRHSHNSHVH